VLPNSYVNLSEKKLGGAWNTLTHKLDVDEADYKAGYGVISQSIMEMHRGVCGASSKSSISFPHSDITKNLKQTAKVYQPGTYALCELCLAD
jgi:hypothetical protein